MIYLLATNNPNKAREIRPMFEAAGLELISLTDLGLHFEAGEDGQTFADNAMQKAAETAAFLTDVGANSVRPCEYAGERSSPLQGDYPYRKYLTPFNIAVLADDSGLVIDALGGEPGVDSALYMGRDTPYADKCQNLLDRLAGVPDDKRTARFICTLVCILPGGSKLTAEGTVEGRISYRPRGQGGFGYDPIFYYPPYGKTLAELTQDEKNHISHRGQAIQKMIGQIINANTGNK